MFLPTLFGVSCRDIFFNGRNISEMHCRQSLGNRYEVVANSEARARHVLLYVWDVTQAVAAHSFRRNCCRREQGLISSPLFNKLHIQSGSNMAHHNPHVASTWPNIFPTWFKTAFWVVVLVLVLVVVVVVLLLLLLVLVVVAAGAARFNPVLPDAFSFVSMGSVGIFPADQ